jgi:DNA-binding response OmpR family regulator
MILTLGRYLPEAAHTAKKAKPKLSQTPFAAMALDLALPDQDGVSLIREPRNQPATRDLPIIVISANARQGQSEIYGDAVGVIDRLEKPIDTERLENLFRAALPSGVDARPRIHHVEDDPDILPLVVALVSTKKWD